MASGATKQGALEGRRALVTGGGTGIGAGCARALLRDGATVTIVGRREEVLRETAGLCPGGARKLA